MKSGIVCALSIFAVAVLGTVACGDDDATAGGGAPGGPDGGQGDTGTTGAGPDGSTPTNPEPTCEPVAGAPAWTFKDQPIAGWNGNRDKPLEAHVIGMSGLAYGNGTWVALAKSENMTEVTWAVSTDASTWTVKTGPLGGGTQHFSLGAGVLYDGKRFVFFGSGDAGTWAYTSADGQSFAATKVSDKSLPLGLIASNGDKTIVVAGSNGNIDTTADLTSWTAPTTDGVAPGGYLDLAFGNGKFVATTEPIGTPALVSSDGMTFTKISTILNGNVSFGGGAFHARGGGKFHASADGATWTEETPTGTGIGATDGGKLFYLAGRWLIQRLDGQKATSEFGASSDGVIWSEYGTETTGLATPAGRGVQPLGIAYGGCNYISYGNYWNNDATQAPYMIVGKTSPAK